MGSAVLASIVLLLVVAGCQGIATPSPADVPRSPDISAGVAAPSPSPEATPAPRYVEVPTSVPSPMTAQALEVEVLATGLEVPWALAFSPDGRLFLTERPGRLRVIVNGVFQPAPVTILPVAATGEAGLLGLALDPGFQDNHYLYLYYTYRQGRALWDRVVRLTEAGGRTGDQVVLLDGIPGATIHNGGRIKFGPDGKLYITAGDAAQPALAQDLTSLAGKVLRLNPDGSVPADNPFSGSPVFSYGHRNPQGLAWQPGTDKLYATEHGPRGHDEVNLLRAGGNYGWPEIRGQQGEGPASSAPVLESGGSTWAPSGASFCDGPCLPELKGRFLFAGLRSAALWWVDLGSQPPIEARPLLEGRYGRIRDVVQGPDGSIYLLTSNRDGRGSPSPEDDRPLRVVPPSRR